MVDVYSAEGVLLVTVEETAVAATGKVSSTRTFYDAQGKVTDVRTVTWTVNYMEDDEDRVQITRTADGRTRTVTITESGEVFVLEIRNEEYRMQVVDARTVIFVDDAGATYMTAEQTPDGSWQVSHGGDVVTI